MLHSPFILLFKPNFQYFLPMFGLFWFLGRVSFTRARNFFTNTSQAPLPPFEFHNSYLADGARRLERRRRRLLLVRLAVALRLLQLGLALGVLLLGLDLLVTAGHLDKGSKERGRKLGHKKDAWHIRQENTIKTEQTVHSAHKHEASEAEQGTV